MGIMYTPRKQDARLKAFLESCTPHKNVLLVEGARQVGKTWLVEHALSQIKKRSVAINLERDRLMRSLIDACGEFQEFEELLRDRLGFDGEGGQILFIDEAQESANLGQYVRFMKEQWPQATVVLTGSSLRRLFRADVRFPVGRVERLTLSPFAFSEFLVARGLGHLAEELQKTLPSFSVRRHEYLLSLYDEFLEWGGLPAIVSPQEKSSPRDCLERIVADYEEDFRRLLGEDVYHIAMACLRSVANHVGNVSKLTTVIPSPSSGMSNRINQVFSRLEAWHFILRSAQTSLSPEKSHKYLPKRYLFDTGVLRHLREAAVPSIRVLDTLDANARRPLRGILENQVAIELAQQFGELNGWKKSPSGTEIDFVIKTKSAAYPVECKAALRVERRHLRGVRDYLVIYGMKTGFIVSLSPLGVFQLPDRMKIFNLPAYLIENLPSYMGSEVDLPPESA
jgi:predicted AAA+ superfamily ATPase